MRFAHLTLENWRNFRHVSVALQNRAFLVGPNASGKSNFLDVFRFLYDLVTPGGGFQTAVKGRGGVSRIRNLAARSPADVTIDVTIQDGDEIPSRRVYKIAFSQDSQGPILKQEQVWQGEARILDRPNDEDRADPARLRQTYLEQTIANRDFRDVAEFFASVHYYHIVPQLVRDPERSTARQDDPYGSDFLERMERTDKRTRDARLRRIEKVLRIAVPQLADLKLEKDDRGVPHLYGKYEHWRPKGAWQTEADFSDGTLRLAGLLWALLEGTGPLLLEEPELSLHPEIVRRIPQMMWRIQRGRGRAIRQVLMSTHSSDLLWDEGIGADEVLLFMPSKEGTELKVGAEIDEVRRLLEAGLTVAEAVIPHTRPADAAQLNLFGD